ncbi:Uncharacterized protein HZ326_31122 [Fusarium oxysporum f. sp. albedinis]|nr:Uncharacterized protein HZ326_31122 [Fusarium oxysporum f. sp. albedinis]
MCIFRPGGQRPRKVSYWSTGRAELNYLQLLSRWTPPRIPAMSTRINGEPLELLPPRAPSYSRYPHATAIPSSSSSISSAQRRFTFKRSSRQRELFLSSLEFSCTDRSSSFPCPKAGEPKPLRSPVAATLELCILGENPRRGKTQGGQNAAL